MSIKRIILANDSRLLREMLRHVISKTDQLEVVQVFPSREALPSAMELFDPEWVILSMSPDRASHEWIETCTAEYPAVRFILFSPDNRSIKKWYLACEEDLTNLSLKDFIDILEKDLQHT